MTFTFPRVSRLTVTVLTASVLALTGACTYAGLTAAGLSAHSQQGDRSLRVVEALTGEQQTLERRAADMRTATSAVGEQVRQQETAFADTTGFLQ